MQKTRYTTTTLELIEAQNCFLQFGRVTCLPANAIRSFGQPRLIESISSGSRPSNCVHGRVEPSKEKTFSHIRYPSSAGTYEIRRFAGDTEWLGHTSYDVFLLPLLKQYENTLVWEKLVSSSKFGLIEFFAELDDTLAMFSSKFIRSLTLLGTYGAYKWGFEPFIADAKNLIDALAKSSTQLDGSRYASKQQTDIDFSTKVGATTYTFKGELITRHSGRVNVPDFSLPLSLLDRFGFHPDLATVWNLVPLSFAIDWLLPIGESIEALRQRGWIRSATFTGWVSHKFVGTVRVQVPGPPSSTGGVDLTRSYKYYSRRRAESFLEVADPRIKVPELDLETAYAHLFDIGYLASGIGRSKT